MSQRQKKQIARKEKKVKGEDYLVIEAGAASAKSNFSILGTCLTRDGVDVGEFCKEFNNEKTVSLKLGVPLCVIFTTFDDCSFTFSIQKNGFNAPPHPVGPIRHVGKLRLF